MEKGDRSEPEENTQEDSYIQDAAECRIQEMDVDDLKSDQKLQKSGDAAQNEASKLEVTKETQQLMQEKPAQKDPTQESLQRSEESESSLQECRELAEDKELELKTDAIIMPRQKGESSFGQEQNLSQRNQPEADAMRQKCDVFEDKPLKSGENATKKETAETPENILLVEDQKSVREENSVENQECEDEPLLPKPETNLIEQLKEESTILLNEDPLQAAQQGAKDAVQQESDGTTGNDRYFQDDESVPESQESRNACSRTRQLEEDASRPSPRRTCHHRACNTRHHILQSSRLPPVPEDPEPPPTPFEVEILVRRHRRMLGVRLPTLLPTGMRDYMQRVRDRHIPPERQALCEELQSRCVKLFFSLLIGGILVAALYFLIDFLERKYGSSDDTNATSPSANFGVNLNISMSTLKPELFVSYLDVNNTTPDAGLDTEVIPVPNDMKYNDTNFMIDFE
ncbi:unnamed protein product [Larinioides sclopetarius]